ncbi:3-oxoacyl-[acyl-carrier-protein] synthase 3 [Striga asiatica]|uniref:3-oxoacyl-[acyl-carrier-protein] synthase 3 n=1 Tax=Striga asiatica TaxID=4170 RepID=A0A5A7PF79_STRAF|nr:3-oxoacyl-[acyl-carrier-protein] synthase 3 [Striga asiatica]
MLRSFCRDSFHQASFSSLSRAAAALPAEKLRMWKFPVSRAAVNARDGAGLADVRRRVGEDRAERDAIFARGLNPAQRKVAANRGNGNGKRLLWLSSCEEEDDSGFVCCSAALISCTAGGSMTVASDCAPMEAAMHHAWITRRTKKKFKKNENHLEMIFPLQQLPTHSCVDAANPPSKQQAFGKKASCVRIYPMACGCNDSKGNTSLHTYCVTNARTLLSYVLQENEKEKYSQLLPQTLLFSNMPRNTNKEMRTHNFHDLQYIRKCLSSSPHQLGVSRLVVKFVHIVRI